MDLCPAQGKTVSIPSKILMPPNVAAYCKKMHNFAIEHNLPFHGPYVAKFTYSILFPFLFAYFCKLGPMNMFEKYLKGVFQKKLLKNAFFVQFLA